MPSGQNRNTTGGEIYGIGNPGGLTGRGPSAVLVGSGYAYPPSVPASPGKQLDVLTGGGALSMTFGHLEPFFDQNRLCSQFDLSHPLG